MFLFILNLKLFWLWVTLGQRRVRFTALVSTVRRILSGPCRPAALQTQLPASFPHDPPSSSPYRGRMV